MVIKVRKSCQVRHQDRVSELGDLSGEILQTTAGGGEMRTASLASRGRNETARPEIQKGGIESRRGNESAEHGGWACPGRREGSCRQTALRQKSEVRGTTCHGSRCVTKLCWLRQRCWPWDRQADQGIKSRAFDMRVWQLDILEDVTQVHRE